MPELEKVIKGLEDRIADAEYIDDGYYAEYVAVELLQAALALLKAQVPRVMTLEEVQEYDEWMWVEYRRGYCGWQKAGDEDCGSEVYIVWNDNTLDDYCEYGKRWRCWTARPTEEQRREVAWDG